MATMTHFRKCTAEKKRLVEPLFFYSLFAAIILRCLQSLPESDGFVSDLV